VNTHGVGAGGGMGPQLNLNDIGRNCLLGYRKKIAKFLMRTFTCRSTFLYGKIAYFKGNMSRDKYFLKAYNNK
jgi:hypothetical protein